MPDEREPRVLGEAPGDVGDGAAKAPSSEDARAVAVEPIDAAAPLADLDGDPTVRQKSLEEALDDALDEEAAAAAAPIQRATPLAKRSAGPTFYVAGFWRRFAAASVDLAIIVPVAYVLCWIAGSLAGVHLPESRHRGLDFWLDLFLDSDPALVGALGLTLAIGAIYVMVFQVTAARTPGMRLLKTRIIDVYGDPPSTGRALARTAGYLAGVATLALGFVWIGFDSEKRGLHDWVSGTYVVKG
jgi:uncharacterized RDD family membrane protein YckC